MNEIKNILILVEMNDGKVRQVLASKEIKESYLSLITERWIPTFDGRSDVFRN